MTKIPSDKTQHRMYVSTRVLGHLNGVGSFYLPHQQSVFIFLCNGICVFLVNFTDFDLLWWKWMWMWMWRGNVEKMFVVHDNDSVVVYFLYFDLGGLVLVFCEIAI